MTKIFSIQINGLAPRFLDMKCIICHVKKMQGTANTDAGIAPRLSSPLFMTRAQFVHANCDNRLSLFPPTVGIMPSFLLRSVPCC
jgi:hypothetical protein